MAMTQRGCLAINHRVHVLLSCMTTVCILQETSAKGEWIIEVRKRKLKCSRDTASRERSSIATFVGK